MFLWLNTEIGDTFHAFHYTEPQAGIFVFVAVGYERDKDKKKVFFLRGGQNEKTSLSSGSEKIFRRA